MPMISELTPEFLRDQGWSPRGILRSRQSTHPHVALPSAASTIAVRKDITPVTHTKRGNLQMAVLASYDTNKKRTQHNLTDGFYAPTSQERLGAPLHMLGGCHLYQSQTNWFWQWEPHSNTADTDHPRTTS